MNNFFTNADLIKFPIFYKTHKDYSEAIESDYSGLTSIFF